MQNLYLHSTKRLLWPILPDSLVLDITNYFTNKICSLQMFDCVHFLSALFCHSSDITSKFFVTVK